MKKVFFKIALFIKCKIRLGQLSSFFWASPKDLNKPRKLRKLHRIVQQLYQIPFELDVEENSSFLYLEDLLFHIETLKDISEMADNGKLDMYIASICGQYMEDLKEVMKKPPLKSFKIKPPVLLIALILTTTQFLSKAGKDPITEEELASLHFVEWCYRNNIPDREYTTEDYNLYLDVFLETDESIELWDSLVNQYEVITLNK